MRLILTLLLFLTSPILAQVKITLDGNDEVKEEFWSSGNNREVTLQGLDLDNVTKKIEVQATTSGSTPAALTTDGSAATSDNVFLLEEGKVYFVITHVVAARDGGSEVARYSRRALMKNVGGTVSLVGIVLADEFSENPAWELALGVDNLLDCLALIATGEAGYDVHWKGSISWTEVDF